MVLTSERFERHGYKYHVFENVKLNILWPQYQLELACEAIPLDCHGMGTGGVEYVYAVEALC